MKRFLALLIAVLMVVGMIPATVLSAAAEEIGNLGGPSPQPAPAPEQPAEPQIDPADPFAVYDAGGNPVGSYATLAEADAVLADGYVLEIQDNYDLGDETYAWGAGRGEANTYPETAYISYTVNGNGFALTSSADVAMTFAGDSFGDDVTLVDLTVIAAQNAVVVMGEEEGLFLGLSVTLDNCQLYAGDAYAILDPDPAVTPVASSSAALDINSGASVRVLGEETAFVSSNGPALYSENSGLYVEDGVFYSLTYVSTAMVVGGSVNIADGIFLNNSNAAITVAEGALVTVSGGTFAQTGDVCSGVPGMPVVAVMVFDALMAVTNATIVVPANAVSTPANGTDPAVRDNTTIYGIYAESGYVRTSGATVLCTSAANLTNVSDPMELLAAGVAIPTTTEEENTVELPFGCSVATTTTIVVALDATLVDPAAAKTAGFALAVTDATGKIVAVGNMDSFLPMVHTVPNGGTLNVLEDIDGGNQAFPNFFDMLPPIDFTLNGVPQTAGGMGIMITTAVAGYMMEICTYANVTLTNIYLMNKNKVGGGVAVRCGEGVADAASSSMVYTDTLAPYCKGVITLGEEAYIVAALNQALYVGTGATVIVGEDAGVGSMELTFATDVVSPYFFGVAIEVEAGGSFTLDGGMIMAGEQASNQTAVFTSRNVDRSFVVGGNPVVTHSYRETEINLLAGIISVPGSITSLHVLNHSSSCPTINVAPGVEIVSAVMDSTGTEPTPVASVVTGSDATLYPEAEGATLELLDADGEHVGYYFSLADALEDVEDGYTVQLLADHVEGKKISVALGEITWTLEGNDHNFYLLGTNFLGFQLNGTGTTTVMQNMTLYTPGYGIFTSNIAENSMALLHDVFVYADGAIGPDYKVYTANQDAIRVSNEWAEIIITGEDSGAFIWGGAYDATTGVIDPDAVGGILLNNRGFLAVYDGYYTAKSTDYIIQNYGTNSGTGAGAKCATTFYAAGGTFVSSDIGRFVLITFYGAKAVVLGGDFINASSNASAATVRFNSGGTCGYMWIFGGRFYTNQTIPYFLQATHANRSFIKYYGGEFYNLEDCSWVSTGWSNTTDTWKYGPDDVYKHGYYIADGWSTVNTENYVAAEGTDPAEVVGNTYFKQAVLEDEAELTQLGFTKGEYVYKIYASRLIDDAPVVGIYDETLLREAFAAAGPYEGTVEMQRDVTGLRHTTRMGLYEYGPASLVILTSAADAPNGYYTYESSAGMYLLWVYGGTLKFENVTFENLAGQVIQINYTTHSVTTIVVGEGGEISTYNSGILAIGNAANAVKCVVEEGGIVNAKHNALTGAAPGANLLRAENQCIFEVYGKLGYNRDGSIGTEGAWTPINWNGGHTSLTDETGLSADIYIGGTAMLATPDNTTATRYTISVATYWDNPDESGASNNDYRESYNINVTAAPGAIFQTNYGVIDARAGTYVDFDGVNIYSTKVPAAGEEYEYAKCAKGYAILLYNASASLKNIEYHGTANHFALLQTTIGGMPTGWDQDAWIEAYDETVVVENCTIKMSEGGYLPFHVAGSTHTDLIIESGHYENIKTGNLILFSPDAEGSAASTGKTTINGGYFLKAWSAGMFKVQGHREIEVNGGTFESYTGAIFGMTYEGGQQLTGSITINGGDFVTHTSTMFNMGHENVAIDFVVNGGEFRLRRGVDPVDGEALTPGKIFYVRGTSSLTINDGYFEIEEMIPYANTSLIETVDYSTCTINDGYFLHLSNGSTGVLAREDSVLTINGGYIASNGDFVARTMWGSVTNGTNTNGAITNPSNALLIINGGVLELLNRTAHYTHITNAVLSDGGTAEYGTLIVNGGILINSRDTAVGEDVSKGYGLSRQVIMKYNTVGSVIINGGLMAATPAQDYFYFTYGNADGGISIPATNISIRKDGATCNPFGSREYYFASYSQNTLLAPELDSAMDVTVGEELSSLKFTSRLNDVLYGALQTYALGLVAEKGATDYELSYGTVIAPVDYLVMTGGKFTAEHFEAYEESLRQEIRDLYEEIYAPIVDQLTPEQLEALQAEMDAALDAIEIPYFDIPATDAVATDAAGLVFSASIEVALEDKELRYAAVPYVVISLDNGESEIRYGTFNSVKSTATLAEVAERALYDNTDEKVGAYQYDSILVANAYNRFTAEQQAVLVTYLAHKHTFDHTGACTAEGCEHEVGYELVDGDTVALYGNYGAVTYYSLAMTAGVTYAVNFANDFAEVEVYDAEGNLCTMVGNTFTCPAEGTGTYYLVVTCDRVGSTTMTVGHVHQAGYTGYCTVCEEDLAIEIEAEVEFTQPVVKGNNYYYAIELTEGVSYTVTTLNGIATVYNTDGDVCPIENNIFTVAGDTGADVIYYIVIAANYTSANGLIRVEHVHSYDYTGVCIVEGCGHDVSKTLDGASKKFYSNIGGRVEAGDQLFVNITLEEGHTYNFAFTKYIGNFEFYDAEGTKIVTGANNTFTTTYTGKYYLVVTAESDVTGYVYFGIEHEHTYDHRGKCTIQHMGQYVECGKTNYKKVTDSVPTTGLTLQPGVMYQFYIYAYAGVTYHFDVPAGITYRLFGNGATYESAHIKDVSEGGTKLDYTTGNYCDPATTRYLWIQLENTTAEAMTNVSFTVSHVHDCDFKGICQVTDCSFDAGNSITANTAITVDDYAAGNVYYGNMRMTAGTRYTPTLTNAQMTWKLYDKNGVVVQDSASAASFECVLDGTYYLVGTAVGDKIDATADVSFTMTTHAHTMNNKGECTGEGCDYERVTNMDDTVNAGHLSAEMPQAGNYYGSINLVAGETYTIQFSAAAVTFKLYAADGTTEIELDEGSFICETSGLYYMVINSATASAGTVNVTKVHVHDLDYKGACIWGDGYSEGFDFTANVGQVLPIQGMEAGNYYCSMTMQAGYVYTFTTSVPEKLSVVVYDAAGNVLTLTEGAYTCETAGTYYIVMTVTEDGEEGETFTVTAEEVTPPAGA